MGDLVRTVAAIHSFAPMFSSVQFIQLVTAVGALCSREVGSGSFPFPQCGPERNFNSHPQTAPSSELRGVTQEKVDTCWFKNESIAS